MTRNFVSENPQAGGPRVYLSTAFHAVESALLALLPDSDGAAITPDAGVHRITLATVVATDAVTVNGTTLTFVTTGGGEGGALQAGEVLVGESDGAAATNLAAAIDALSGVTASASGSVVTVRSAAAASTITSADTTITVEDLGGWLFLPESDDTVQVNFLHEASEIWPVYMPQATGEIITKKGVESVEFGFPRSSVEALNVFLTQATMSSTAAGAAKVAKTTMSLSGAPSPTVYRHLVQVVQRDTGYWQMQIFPKVSPQGAFGLPLGHDVVKTVSRFKVFAHAGCTTISPILQIVEMTGPATS